MSLIKSKSRINNIGEVFTSDFLVSAILDQFPITAWSQDKNWLEPTCGNGQFLLAVIKRKLQYGSSLITALDTVFGADIMLDNILECHSRILSEIIEPYVKTHLISKIEIEKLKCIIKNNIRQTNDSLKEDFSKWKKCNAPLLDYVKIHNIVGNPPYQECKSNRSDPKNLYPLFVISAMDHNPEYMSMVIPARWMSGSGKEIYSFLKRMIESKKISKITTSGNSKWFNDVDIKGGTMFFLYDKYYNKNIININGKDINLEGEDTILTNEIDISIKNKILSTSKTFEILGTNPYSIASNFKNWSLTEECSYICHCSGYAGKGINTNFISKDLVKKNIDTIPKYKVCIATAYGRGSDGLGEPFMIGPNHIVSQSYTIVYSSLNEEEASNVENFLTTRFAQYLVSLVKKTQDNSKRVFKYLPYLNFSKPYSDMELYKMYNLSSDEIIHLENATKDFPIFKLKPIK